MKKVTGSQCKAFRVKTGINQKLFWTLLGVTQSAGSRYETGRGIPKPTQVLAALVYGIGDAEKLQRELLTAADKLVRQGVAKKARAETEKKG